MRLEIVSTDIGPDEVVPQIALLDDSDETVAVVVGERTAQLFAAAEEMLAVLRRVDDPEARTLVERIDNASPLKIAGVSMLDLLERVVRGN